METAPPPLCSDPVQIHAEEGILWIALNNPPHNLLGSSFFKAIETIQERIAAPEIRAVVITGTGRSFSKGVDLREMTATHGPFDEQSVIAVNKQFSAIEHLRKPVIAAINGACFGGGLELSLCCHIRVCSEKARLGLPELTAGIVPGLGGITRLIRIVGEARALELMLLGDLIVAEKALAYGLVSRVFPSDGFQDHVRAFTRAILAARPETIHSLFELVAMHRYVHERGPIEAAARSFAWLAKNVVAPF